MQRFEIESGDHDLTSHSGLALIGAALHNKTHLKWDLKSIPIRQDAISHADILHTYIGLLSTGKNDFEAASIARDEDYFQLSLGLTQYPSKEILRQRMDK